MVPVIIMLTYPVTFLDLLPATTAIRPLDRSGDGLSAATENPTDGRP
jgi:hypothetical protein